MTAMDNFPSARQPGVMECELCANSWLVRVYLGARSPDRKAQLSQPDLHGPFREAQRFLNLKPQQRDPGRAGCAAAITLNQFLDQWLAMVARPRLKGRFRLADPNKCGRVLN